METTTPDTHYPRVELFGGGSYAEAGLFNAGHWAGLPGWDASLGLNATNWLGFVIEGGQYFGTSKIPSATPEPFPPAISPTSRLPRRHSTFRRGNTTFFLACILHGASMKCGRRLANSCMDIQGTRGEATPVVPGPLVAEVGTGRAIIVGGGLDRKINERFALRFKADYFQTATDFPVVGKQRQDNFRFSVGVVIRNVHKKKRRLEDETEPTP